MATYTHSTSARYTHGSTNRIQSAKGARSATFARAATSMLSRARPTSAASTNAKQIFGPDFPGYSASLNTGFTPATGVVTRGYRNAAVGSKVRTRT